MRIDNISFGDNKKPNNDKEEKLKILNEIRPGEKIDYNGPILVKGDVGDGAYIKATGLKVEGNVYSNVGAEVNSSGGGGSSINISGGKGIIITGGSFSGIVNGQAFVNGQPVNSGQASSTPAVSGITVNGFVADNVTLRCNNDSINLNDVGNSNTIVSKNGSIRTRNIGTRNDITTKNGSINVGDVGQRTTLDTKNGSITARNVYAYADLESKNGSVRAYASHATATLSSKNGRIDRGYDLQEAGQDYSQSHRTTQQQKARPATKQQAKAKAKPTPKAPSSLVPETKRIYKLPRPAKVNGEMLSEQTVFMPRVYLSDTEGAGIAVEQLQRDHNVRLTIVKAEKMPFKSAREMGTFIALNFDLSPLDVNEGIEFCKSVEQCRGGHYTGAYHTPNAPKGFEVVDGTRDVFENRDKIFIPRKYFESNPDMWSKLDKVVINGNETLNVEFNNGIGFAIKDKLKSADQYVAISKPTRGNGDRADKINELKRFAVELENDHKTKVQQSRALGM